MPTLDVRIPGPDLGRILAEISERICHDDWERRSTPGDEIVYYIVGFDAHKIDVRGALSFLSEFPLPSQTSPMTQWYTRAQVAAGHPDYVKDAHARLVALGVPERSIDAFLAGGTDEVKTWHLGSREHLEALNNLLEAVLITRRAVADVDADDRQRLSSEREKAYLRDVTKRYVGLLGRVALLDPLEFADSQLEEASRCYLYGFNRAAVVCAAASVETHLKRRTGKKRFEKYGELVESALWAGILDGSHQDAANRVFQTRNRVVHEGLNPSIDEAATTLIIARGVVESLHQGR